MALKSTETRLDIAAALQRALLESSPAVIFATDREGIIQVISAAAVRLIGVSAQQVLGKRTPVEFVDADQLAKRTLEFEETHGRPPVGAPDWELFLLPSDSSTEREWNIRRPDGSSHLVSLSFSHIRNADGEPIGIVAIGQDVTARVRVARSLLTANARLAKRVTEQSEALTEAGTRLRLSDASIENSSVATFWLTSSGRAVRYNAAALRLLGAEPEALKGMRVTDVVERFPLSLWQQHWTELRRRGALRLELRLRRADGRIVPVEAQASALDFEGDELAVVFLRDESEQKNAEASLRRSEEALLSRNRILAGITAAQSTYLTQRDIHGAMAILLRQAIEITGSGYGFLGAVMHDGVVRVLAFQGIEWHPSAGRGVYESAMQERLSKGHFEFRENDALYRSAITSGLPVITNDPAADPRARGLPEGHPPLLNFLSVPLSRSGSARGLLTLANREGGFLDRHAHDLEEISVQASILCEQYHRDLTESELRDQRDRTLRELQESLAAMHRSEIEAEKNRDLFESLATRSPVAVFLFDRSGGTRFFNSQIETILGAPCAELAGFHWMKMAHPDDRSRLRAEWERVFLEGKTVRFETRLRHADGSVRWVIVRVAPLQVAEGVIQTAVGTVVDTTENKRMERALRIIATELTTADGVEGFYHDAVLHVAALLETDVAFIALVESAGARTARTVAVAIDGAIAENFDYGLSGTPCADVVKNSDIVVPSNLRRLFPADPVAKRLAADSYAGVCLRDSRGRVIGLLAIASRSPMVDPDKFSSILQLFATRIAAEVETERSETSFRDLFAFAPDALLMSDRDGGITLANQAAANMFGYELEEMIGLSVETLAPPMVRGIHARLREAYLAVPQTRPMADRRGDLFAHRKDGSSFPVEIALSPLTTRQGVIVVAAIRDVTERHRAEEEQRNFTEELERRVAQRTVELEAANRELDSFSASVSHDLRAPLRRINGFASLLHEQIGDRLAEEELGWLRMIERSSMEMAGLIRDLLAAAQAARSAICERPLDLASMMRETMLELSADLTDRKIEFSIEVLPRVLGDRVLMRQVVANLLSNAVKYTRSREDSRIAVGIAGRESDRVILFVRDNGVGIDMTHADKLFGLFQRMPGSEGYEGTGVGLATTKRIIERHGGRIWVESEPDRGATFFFTLVAAPED